MAGLLTSCIPLKAPRTTACIPSKSWKTPAIINSFDAISKTWFTSVKFKGLLDPVFKKYDELSKNNNKFFLAYVDTFELKKAKEEI